MSDPGQETADSPRLDYVGELPASDGLAGLARLLVERDWGSRLEQLSEALAAGRVAATRELIQALAAEVAPALSVTQTEASGLVYWAAVRACLRRPEFGQAMAEIDKLLIEAGSGPEWDDSDEGVVAMQTLATALVPMAGLDLPATVEYTQLYLANFPAFSRPLGDVDERASRWLAQLLDVGPTRAGLRRMLAELADSWAEQQPLAAARVRSWAEAALPADPTRDLPWARALLALARTQV